MNNNRKLFTAVSITVIVTALLTFIATANIFASQDLLKTNTVISLLNDYFYKEINMDLVDEATARAAVTSLKDPYTVYMSPEEWESFKTELNDNYCGIGVSVTKESLESYVLIADAFENSPAKEVGLTAGDLIAAVDGETTKGLDLNQVVSKIKGDEGTTVTLTVIKNNTQTETKVTVTRRTVDIESLTSEIINNNIGYLKLTTFNENCSVKFSEHLTKLKNQGASSIIIDLRDNGGGISAEAENIASEFLPKGRIIYSTKNKAGKINIIKSKKEGDTDIPVVILVNGNTASASEILSSAIKENNRGVLVGEKTFGKGLVQTVYTFYDDSALKITIEQYFTALGNDINKIGVEPNYEVELKSENDEQLQYAIKLLTK